MTGFARQLADPTIGFALDVSDEPAPLLVAFGGISGGLAIPPFEFFGLTGSLPVHKLYLRDLDQAWYQRGVRGFGDSIPAVAHRLRDEIHRVRPTRTVAVGNSAGGFAALLFGALVGFDDVQAFAPQTSIERAFRRRHRDLRWWSQIRALRRRPVDHPTEDLVAVLRDATASDGTRAVHHAVDDRLDVVHARHVAGLPGVVVRSHRAGGHGLVRHLRDTGVLAELLFGSLTAGRDGHGTAR